MPDKAKAKKPSPEMQTLIDATLSAKKKYEEARAPYKEAVRKKLALDEQVRELRRNASQQWEDYAKLLSVTREYLPKDEAPAEPADK